MSLPKQPSTEEKTMFFVGMIFFLALVGLVNIATWLWNALKLEVACG